MLPQSVLTPLSFLSEVFLLRNEQSGVLVHHSQSLVPDRLPVSFQHLNTHTIFKSPELYTLPVYLQLDVEFVLLKCHLYYPRREYTAVFLAAVYTPLRPNSTIVLRTPRRTVFSKYYQHGNSPSCDENTLGHVYNNIRGAYWAASPTFPSARADEDG